VKLQRWTRSASATGDTGKRLNVVGFHSAGGEEATPEQRKTRLCDEGREREALGDSLVQAKQHLLFLGKN